MFYCSQLEHEVHEALNDVIFRDFHVTCRPLDRFALRLRVWSRLHWLHLLQLLLLAVHGRQQLAFQRRLSACVENRKYRSR